MLQTSLSAGAGLGGKSQDWRLLQAHGPVGDRQDMSAVLPSGSKPAQEIRQPKNNSKQRKGPPPPPGQRASWEVSFRSERQQENSQHQRALAVGAHF